jgi:hypothetical protein
LIPLLIGLGMLFFNGRSIIGWLLIAKRLNHVQRFTVLTIGVAGAGLPFEASWFPDSRESVREESSRSTGMLPESDRELVAGGTRSTRPNRSNRPSVHIAIATSPIAARSSSIM